MVRLTKWDLAAALVLAGGVGFMIAKMHYVNKQTTISGGNSMEPTLHVGDSLTFDPSPSFPYDAIVILQDPEKGGRLVKRLKGLPHGVVNYQGRHLLLDANEYWVIGDNNGLGPDGDYLSRDSRTFGVVPRDCLEGVVTAVDCPH